MDGDLALRLYRDMYLIRRFEERVGQLFRRGLIPGFVHSAAGQEAPAVAVAHNLAEGDVVFSGHRAHGHILALGADPKAVLKEILGKKGGLSYGRAGSMHLFDPSVGFLGASGVVGATLAIALGAALAVRDRGNIAVVFFGDGASTTGVFHESLNLASLWELPVLFVCENNGYAEFSARSEQSRVAHVSRFAETFGIPAEVVGGEDARSVYAAARRAVADVRRGAPFLLEVEVVRLSGHYEGDPETYRNEEDEARLARDPVGRLRRLLAEEGVGEEALRLLEAEVEATVEAAEREAVADVYAEGAYLGRV